MNNKQEFEWFGLRFAKTLVYLFPCNYIDRMFKNVGGYEVDDEYDSQTLKLFDAHLVRNFGRGADCLDKLATQSKYIKNLIAVTI